jgi:hypothetical protein
MRLVLTKTQVKVCRALCDTGLYGRTIQDCARRLLDKALQEECQITTRLALHAKEKVHA